MNGSGSSAPRGWLFYPAALVLLLALQPAVLLAQEQDSDCAGADPCPAQPGATDDQNWVDTSYEYVTTRSDSLAVWLDSFFGVPEADLEWADSVLRLRSELEWDEQDGYDSKIRLRGKVDLPRINKRLSLVFSEEDEDRDEILPDSQGGNSGVGLQYELNESRRSRLYFSVGTNASLEFKSSLRYRYILPISEDWRVQFSERLYYKEDDGFGTLSRVDLDYSVSDNRIIRWTNQADYGEETEGVEWGTRLNYQIRLNEKEALSYFGAVAGETDPKEFTRAYSLGVRYRRNIFRPWIFIEVEPSHLWRREAYNESRDSVWVTTFRVEFLEELSNRRGGIADAVQDSEH